MSDDGRVSVAELDGAEAGEAAGLLRPACASGRWVAGLVGGRPYRSLDALLAASDAAIAGLGWADVEEALAAHPRIGERAAGAGQEAAWSRGEQAGAQAAGADVQAALAAGNAEYEARFGHVFLICAAGRSGAEMLAELRARLANEPGGEQQVVRRELGLIARLRLARTFR
jgi:2-oxo-4-hydroxy-4-carboxy-5-ureidoimidazoline decarboxylase